MLFTKAMAVHYENHTNTYLHSGGKAQNFLMPEKLVYVVSSVL
jgi:hypothetical protein